MPNDPKMAPHAHRFPDPQSDHIYATTSRWQNGQSMYMGARPRVFVPAVAENGRASHFPADMSENRVGRLALTLGLRSERAPSGFVVICKSPVWRTPL